MTAVRPDARVGHVRSVIIHRFGRGAIGEVSTLWGEDYLRTSRDRLLVLLQLLRDDADLEMRLLLDITAVDHGPAGESDDGDENGAAAATRARFSVLYRLRSPRLGYRATLEVPVDEADPAVPTTTGLFAAADWYERELWEMYGIYPDGHPHLRPLLMYEQFAGHPLRRDYPGAKAQPLVPLHIDVRDDDDSDGEEDDL